VEADCQPLADSPCRVEARHRVAPKSERSERRVLAADLLQMAVCESAVSAMVQAVPKFLADKKSDAMDNRDRYLLAA